MVVITKNEEGNIGRCLASVDWASDVVVVDAQSTDRTVEIAERWGARVIRKDWPGYGAQKNYGIAQTKQTWVLCIDADEVVTAQLADEIPRRLANRPQEVAFRIRVPTFLLGRPLGHYGRAARDPGHIRLFRKDRGKFDDRAVHESVQVDGNVGWLGAPILHYCYPTLRTYWRKIHYYANLEAQHRASCAPVRGNQWLRAASKLAWMLFWRRGLLDGPHAWLWIAGQAYQEWLTTGEAARLRRQEAAHAPA